jgi:hypothetical protein
MNKTQSYLILDVPLIMESERDESTGTVTVNGIEYSVYENERWQVSVNDEKVHNDWGYFNRNVEAYIVKHQKITAWQQAQYGVCYFNAIKNNTTMYDVLGFLSLYVYRAADGTCWRYCTDEDDFEFRSPWFPSEIKPSAEHFTAWVMSSIEVK